LSYARAGIVIGQLIKPDKPFSRFEQVVPVAFLLVGTHVPYGSLPIGVPIGPEHTTTSFGIGTCKAIGWLVSNSEQE